MRAMREKLTIAVLTAVFVLVPPPVNAANFSDSVFTTGGDSGKVLADLELDKEKPSKPKKEETKEKKKKKFDDFKDANGNGIDDRYEKKESPKKKPKGESEEVNF